MKKFIITGGNFSNKGAQAMTLAVIQELKSKYPDCKIWVFTSDHISPQESFEVLFFNKYLLIRVLLGRFKFLMSKNLDRLNEEKVRQALKSADLVLDISGFALSSQFGVGPSLSYILRIALMKKYNRQLVLLPQSFGPFNYGNFYKAILFPLFKRYLKYPVMIYARERQGYNDLKKFTTKNLDLSVDIVLQTEKPQQKLFSFDNRADEILVPEKSVAFIPNSKLIKWNHCNDILNLYFKLAETLSKNGFHIYILRHSKEDLKFCQDVYDRLKGFPDVSLLENDFNCIESAEIISKMALVIASRYHSLIHSYKSGVPALVLGWAEKYRDVMQLFNQERYYYDIRELIQTEEIPDCLHNLLTLLKKEKESIESRRSEFLRNNILRKIG